MPLSALWSVCTTALPSAAQTSGQAFAQHSARAPTLDRTARSDTAPVAVSVGYREAADRFEVLDQVSAWWPEYVDPAYRRAWTARGLARPGDSAAFVAYARLRARHVDRTHEAGSDATAWRADSTGSGLFSAGAGLTADPVATAFYMSATVDEALARLTGVLTVQERSFFRAFYRQFATRVDPLLAETRARTAPSQKVTVATLADTAVVAYLGRVAGLFAPAGGGATATPTDGAGHTAAHTMEALYVWWPDTAQTRASPVGRTLLLRVRPPTSDTLNSADVIAHEVVHVLAAEMPPATQRALSAAVLAGCAASHGPPAGVRRLAVLEEPIATALGNLEFRRRFQPQRFAWGRRWYGDPWVDVYARLLHPVLIERLASGRALDAAFARDAGAVCAALARLAPSTGA